MIAKDVKAKLCASIIHFCFSVMLMLAVVYAIFNWWFPYPFEFLLKGGGILWIMFGVHVVCGPVLTAVVFNPRKSKSELIFDFSFVVLLQLAALAYGGIAVSQLRPVAIVYEIDRFVVVSAGEINNKWYFYADDVYKKLPIDGGLWLLSIRDAVDEREAQLNMILSLQGSEPSTRANWWQSYNAGRADAKANMKPLLQKVWLNDDVLQKILTKINQPIEKLFYLPLTSGDFLDKWIVILNDSADIVGYAPVDGFD